MLCIVSKILWDDEGWVAVEECDDIEIEGVAWDEDKEDIGAQVGDKIVEGKRILEKVVVDV